jgi:hypothetical protein
MDLTPAGGSHGNLHRTTKILSRAWRRCSRVAAHGAGAAERADAAYWLPHSARRRSRRTGPHYGFPARACSTGLDGAATSRLRAVGRRTPSAFANTRQNSSRLHQTLSSPGAVRRSRRCGRRPASSDRVRVCRRSRRRWIRREPRAAGRQCHRFHGFRIQHGREMAGIAQGDRTAYHASGGVAGCWYCRWKRAVGRDSVRRYPVRGGIAPGRYARRR